MRRPFSLALRLTLLFVVAAAIAFPMFGWVVIESMENHFREQDNDELKIVASAVQDVLSSKSAAGDWPPSVRRLDDILVGHHHASLYVVESDGRVIYASSELDLSALAKTRATATGSGRIAIHEWQEAEKSYHVLTQEVMNTHGSYQLVVAVPIGLHLSFLREFRQRLWSMIAGCVTLMSFIGWIAVRRGHAPLRDMIARIRRISANELNTRLSPDAVPGELSELASSFNDMLKRVDEAFHRRTEFNADIAHELRTPIANLMTQTQVGLARDRSAEEYREMLYSNMEEYERMAQMVGDMLYLAQADTQKQLQGAVEVDLATEVRTLFEFYEGWADERRVSLALTGDAQIWGDRLMLQRALGNLLSNAIRHTPDSGTVSVDLSMPNERDIRLVIKNPGKTIPSEHISRVFDRFYRVDRSRKKGDQGAGLGLAIAQSIAAAHSGHIDVESQGGWTSFSLTLPKRPQQSEQSGRATRLGSNEA